MTLRDIQHRLAAAIGTERSSETVSKITDKVREEVLAWQRRPLEAFYPVIHLDALVVKVRDGAQTVPRPPRCQSSHYLRNAHSWSRSSGQRRNSAHCDAAHPERRSFERNPRFFGCYSCSETAPCESHPVVRVETGGGVLVSDPSSVDFGLAILRVAAGMTMAAHGYAKIFRGGKLTGTARWFDSIGMRPGRLHARVAAITEMAAGLLLAVGLLTSLAGAAFVALMVVAGWTLHRTHGFFIVNSGWEYNFILAITGITIATTGPGRFSLDYRLFVGPGWTGWWGLAVALGLGMAGAVGQLILFWRPPSVGPVTTLSEIN